MSHAIDTVAAILGLLLYFITLGSFLNIAFTSWRRNERDGGVTLGISMTLLLLILACLALSGIIGDR